jgi:hypothetical protein
MKGARRFILIFSTSLGVVAGAVITFNFVVDPLQYYRVSTLYRPVFWGGMQRFQNAGLARNYAQDVVVVGSSVTENFLASHIERSWGRRATRLSISGSTAHEQFLVLRLALQTGRVKHVLWGLDTGAFYLADQVREDQGQFPYYLYRVNYWPNLEYLLSLGTTRLSTLALRGYGITDLDKYHTWFDQFEFSEHAVLAKWKGNCDEFQDKFQSSKMTISPALLATMRASVESNLLSLIRAYPEVTFDLFLPPVSALTYVPAGHGILPVSLSFRETAMQESLKYANVRLYDFQTAEWIVNDLNNFKDQIHFGLNISDYIIDAIRDDRNRVHAGGIPAANRHLVDIANRFDLCKAGRFPIRAQGM